MGLGTHWPRIENTTFVIVRAVSMGSNLRYEELEKSSELWIGGDCLWVTVYMVYIRCSSLELFMSCICTEPTNSCGGLGFRIQ